MNAGYDSERVVTKPIFGLVWYDVVLDLLIVPSKKGNVTSSAAPILSRESATV